MASISTQDIQAGAVIRDRYRIQSPLGHGGFGVTYLARDLKKQTSVAIKTVSLERLQSWKTLELLKREVKVLQNLDHPAIPKYLDSFSTEGDRSAIFYLVQELAPGKPLYQWIESGWQPSETEVLSIAESVLSTLAYLQSLTPPIIHRDIKPQNILRDREGNVYLVDFGSVQDTFRQTVAGGSTVVGTFGYMAPEQFRGQASLSTDLYGLGATLIYLLAGKDPSELPEKKLQIDFRAEVQVNSFLGQWLDSTIAPASERRLPSAATALMALSKEYPLPQQAQAFSERVSISQTEQSLEIDISPAGLHSLSAGGIVSCFITLSMALALIVLSELPSIMVSPAYRILPIMTAAISLPMSIYCIAATLSRHRLEFVRNRFRLWSGVWVAPYREDWPSLLYSATAAKDVSMSKITRIGRRDALIFKLGKYRLKIRNSFIFMVFGKQTLSFGHGLHPQDQEQVRKIVTLFLQESSVRFND